MLKKLSLLFAPFIAVIAVMGFNASAAFAYGQCGSGTSNPVTWVHQLQEMGVLNQTGRILQYAGYHRMDGGFPAFVQQRVVMVHLRKPADPEDFGCHPGTVFSVGHRWLPAGTPVFVVLPRQYAKSSVSTHPRKGWHRKAVCSKGAGKVNCTNPEKGTMCYYLWFAPNKRHHKKHPHPCGCQSTPHPPTPTCGPNQTMVNGACQTQTVTQNCGEGTVWNGQECVAVQNNCGNVNTGNGSPNQGGNCICVGTNVCNQTPPPPPPPTCQYGGEYPNCSPPPCTVTNTCLKPPPTHWTQVTCTGFEEISGGGSFLVDCDVQDDNGAPIALSVSKSPYYTVSGIDCYSQNGTPSCTGNGTFEFRVDGINSTAQVQQASMTVTATANGIPATYSADFNVDPSGGGF